MLIYIYNSLLNSYQLNQDYLQSWDLNLEIFW